MFLQGSKDSSYPFFQFIFIDSTENHSKPSWLWHCYGLSRDDEDLFSYEFLLKLCLFLESSLLQEVAEVDEEEEGGFAR